MPTAKTCCTSVCAQCVTDEQIRELRADASDHGITAICKEALGELPCFSCRTRALRMAAQRARARVRSFAHEGHSPSKPARRRAAKGGE